MNHDYLAADIARHFADNEFYPNLIRTNKSQWLGDATINGMFTLYEYLDSKMHNIEGGWNQSIFIDSLNSDMLFDEINERNWEAIKKRLWNRVNRAHCRHIFELDRIFIAQHKPGHWTFTVIFIKQMAIVYYDSFNSIPTDDVKNPNKLLLWLEMEAHQCNVPFNRSVWHFTCAKCIPQVGIIIIKI
jgi:hypothetical protein